MHALPRLSIVDDTPMTATPKPARTVDPVRRIPIPWGKPDRALARGICRHIVEATPPTVIPFDPRTDARMRRDLRSHGIHH